MLHPEFANAIHVVSSKLACETLAKAFGICRNDILTMDDNISHGPNLSTPDPSLYDSIRQQYQREQYQSAFDKNTRTFQNSLILNRERLRDNAITLWQSQCLDEQLLPALIVYLLDTMKIESSRLQVVQLTSLPKAKNILMVGELEAHHLKNQPLRPVKYSSNQIDGLRAAWKAFTSKSPEDLEHVLKRLSALPLLFKALQQLIYRYPDIASGLTRPDEMLLKSIVKHGPCIWRSIGHAMISIGDTLDFTSDHILHHRLLALSNLNANRPLVTIRGESTDRKNYFVHLTDFGKQVLSRKANHIEENGIDDWIGGVHLTTNSPVTYRNNDRLIRP